MEFLNVLGQSGVASVKIPPRSPNLNAYAERFVRSIKESCLERMILFGEGSVRKATTEFVAHYHLERNHQGLGNRLISRDALDTAANGDIEMTERFGGLRTTAIAERLSRSIKQVFASVSVDRTGATSH